MERDRDVVVVGGWFLDIDKNGVIKGCNWFIKPGIVNEQLKYGNAVASSSSLIRRSVIIENNEWFDQSFWPRDDYHMWVRLAKYGKVVVIPDIIYLYRHHPDQSIRKHRSLKTIPFILYSRIRYYRQLCSLPEKVYLLYWKFLKWQYTNRLRNKF